MEKNISSPFVDELAQAILEVPEGAFMDRNRTWLATLNCRLLANLGEGINHPLKTMSWVKKKKTREI